MHTRALLALSALSFGSLYAVTSHAQSLRDCGSIHVEAEAQCELKGGVSCEAMCTPVSVRAACAGRLTASCEGKCNELPSLDCQGSCQADCTGQCEVDPGRFDCTASCQADCDASCAGHCAAADNRAECEASCQATCGVSCQGKCDVELPEADCDAKCEASCSGSCEADANLDCQLDCQADLYGECETEVSGGCQADCDTEEGALFCDGHYVDHGDHLDMCVSAIQAFIDAHVDGYAEGSAQCGGGSCHAEGKAGVSCSAVPGASTPGALSGVAGLGCVALLFAQRKRRR